MKKIYLLLLFSGISILVMAQQSLESRIESMYKSINTGNIESYIGDYMYNEIFEIVPKDTLVSLMSSIYDSEEYEIDFTVKGPHKISKVIEQNGIKYAYVQNQTQLNFKLKRDYFVQDSINMQKRYDSLRIAMQKDTAYATVLAKHNDENYEYQEDELSIWDFPYYEIPDSTESISTVDELMNEQMSMLSFGFLMVMDKKTAKKINMNIDEETHTFTIDNFMEKGTIAILDPKYKEWQFIVYNTSNPMIMNYLIPIEVRKKLKIK